MSSEKNAAKSPLRWCLIGGGKMGQALASGMMAAGVVSEADLVVVEPNETSASWWKTGHPKVRLLPLAEGIAGSDCILVAVKPGVVPAVLSNPEADYADKLVISIAAGVRLETLIGLVGHDRVVRVMPNTPSLIGHGASAYCVAASVQNSDRSLVEKTLSSVGMVSEVSESQMDAVTGLSGSGPAYVYLFIEALADGGVAAGLPRALAMELAAATVSGAAEMVKQTGSHPGVLKDAVASPGGTTIAGLASLEQSGFRSAAIDAVQAAASRSRELG
ncbi:MAG: pyrroline-5-carboxylate reductase [Planctomycetota bacterium]